MRARFQAFAKNAVLFLLAAAFLCVPWACELREYAMMRILHPELYQLLRGDRRACVRMLEVARKFRHVRSEEPFLEKPKAGRGKPIPFWGPVEEMVTSSGVMEGRHIRGAFRGWGLPGPPRAVEEQIEVVEQHPLIGFINREIYPFTRIYERGVRIWVRMEFCPDSMGPPGLTYRLEVLGVSPKVREAIQECIMAFQGLQEDIVRRGAQAGAEG